MYVHAAESQPTKPTHGGTGVHPAVRRKNDKNQFLEVNTRKMENKYLIEIISSTATLIVAFIGIFGNMYLANQNRKKELLLKEKEIEQEEVKVLLENLKGFWEEQNKVLKLALFSGSVLTLNEDIESDEFLSEYKNLWRLIYAELPMYDVQEVEEALKKLADKVYEKKRINPKDKEAINLKKQEMKPLLTELALSIKETLIVLEYSRKLKNNIKSK